MGQFSLSPSLTRMVTLTCLSFLLLAAAFRSVQAQARFFKTKFNDCGSILNIEDALAGSVSMTAPFNRRTGRHILGKGKQVEICINGTLPSGGLSLPFAGLKNQAHGKIEVEVTWKVLTDSNFRPICEPEFDLAVLKSRGHLPLVCISIPARVQAPRG